jgi:hypothetical protein
LPAAYATGKLTLRPFSIVTELVYDRTPTRPPACASSTRDEPVDGVLRARHLLCASTVASTFILLNSVSDRFPNGFGNDSGELATT